MLIEEQVYGADRSEARDMPVVDNADLNQRLNYELAHLNAAKKAYLEKLDKLRDYKGATLRRSRNHNSSFYYYVKKRDSGSYRYFGKPDHPEVMRVREARFIEEAIRRIDHDIDLVGSLLKGFLPYDPSSVNESLSQMYQCGLPPMSERYALESVRWLERRLTFQKEYPENYPQYKKHRTSDGVMVKTMSELVTYERFKAAGLTQIYELPFIPLDHGPALYPDFTILSPVDMKTEIIVEFVGRMDKQEYREDFAKRVGKYMAKGFIPGVNLFFIFCDSDGNVDSMQISKVIADIFGKHDMSAAGLVS